MGCDPNIHDTCGICLRASGCLAAFRIRTDEARALRDVHAVTTGDVQLGPIETALAAFGVPFQPDAIAIAVFDHGAAPFDVSDRIFRFAFLAETLRRENRLTAFVNQQKK